MMTDDAFRDAVKAALDELARGCANSRAVAARLQAARIYGDRENCLTCPVAIWLLAKLPAGTWVHVWDDGSATVGRPEEVGLDVDLPPVVADFIHAHDHGSFPQLLPQGA